MEKEKKLSAQTRWNKAHPDRAREIWRNASRRYRARLKAAQIAQEGGEANG